MLTRLKSQFDTPKKKEQWYAHHSPDAHSIPLTTPFSQLSIDFFTGLGRCMIGQMQRL